MSIFLAFSLQKRLEHILNSAPGVFPPQPLQTLWHTITSLSTQQWEHGHSCLTCPNCHTCQGCWHCQPHGVPTRHQVDCGSALRGAWVSIRIYEAFTFLLFFLVLLRQSQLEDRLLALLMERNRQFQYNFSVPV